jgi:recombination associated protein RdgC
MGALRGKLTFSKFYVDGQVPNDLPGASMKRIRASAMRPLSPDEDESSRHGWCAIEDPNVVELGHEHVFVDELVCLGLRIDTWVVPKPLLRAHLENAEASLVERKGLEKLGRKAKADLKLFVLKKLRKNLVPASKSIDFVWDTHAGVARFFSQSPKNHLLVQELFEKTFKLRLVPASPGVRADRIGFDARTDARWSGLEPMSLAEAEAS